MTLLPIVERELRVSARRPATYRSRSVAALIGLGVGAWTWVALSSGTPGSFSQSLFYSLSGIAFAYSLLAGLGATADCLSREKREGTLGLLFLTDLRGYDVVLGKLAANSLTSLYRLLAVLPLLSVPLLLGGLDGAAIARMALVLCNTLFLSLCVGILASAMTRHDRKALAGAFALLAFLAIGWPLLGQLWTSHFPASEGSSWRFFDTSSPIAAFGLSLDAQFRALPERFWTSLAVQHVLAWLGLIAACVIVPRSWHDKTLHAETGWSARWQRWCFGDSETRPAHRTKLLNVNPFFWTAARDRMKPAYVWLTLAVIAVAWLWLFRRSPQPWLDPSVFIMVSFLFHTLLRFWVASEACRPLFEERRNGSLELLLSTPLTVRDILRGQFLAVRRQFAGPVVFVLFLDALMMVHGSRSVIGTAPVGWLLYCLGSMIAFVVDLLALCWVGMWLGLTSRRINGAFGGTVLRILFLPVLLFGVVTSVLAFTMANSRSGVPVEHVVMITWFGIKLATSLFFLWWARENLHNEFRNVATEPLDAAKRIPVASSGPKH